MSIKIDSQLAMTKLNLTKEIPDRIMRRAYDFFKKTTPIRSGNARNRTRIQGNEITADYPYAERLDTGWSKQAPNGMSEPTLKEIERLVKAELRKVK